VAVNVQINNTMFCLVNCYAPNTNKPINQQQWLLEVEEILMEYSEHNIIVGGDLNDHFIPHLDKYNCKPKTVETDYVKSWKVICDELNITDIWRTLNPNTRRYTWRQGSSITRLKQSRIDYWLVSAHLMYDLTNVDILASNRSDHSILTIDFFKNETKPRGPSFWRFNANLLKDKTYVEQIKEKLKQANLKYENVNNFGMKWDLIKMEVRSTTICYSKNKAKETRINIKETLSKVDKLEKELNKAPSEEILIEYNNTKKIIEEYNNEKAWGAQIRSKADWAEHGEKNTTFFLNLEKRNYNLKCITKLITDENKEITNEEEILKHEEYFYKQLYSVK
jgi:hypothetical protein